MTLVMSAAEREAFLAGVHVGVHRYASVEGPVLAIQDPARPEDRRTLAERYLGPEGAAQYLEATEDVAGTMVTVWVRPERWYTRDYSRS